MKRFVVLGVGVAAMTLVSACGSSSSTDAYPTITLSGVSCKQPYKGAYYIADIMPFSDNEQVFQDIDYAVQLAVQEINAGGGIHGKPLGMLQCDDQATGSVGLSAMQMLSTVKTLGGVVGGAYSSVAATIAPDLATLQIPLVSPSATSPSLTGASPWFFRTAPSDALQGVVDAQLAKRQGFKKVFVAYRDDAYGTGLSTVFMNDFNNIGNSNSMSYPASGSTGSAFAQVVSAAQAYGADAIFPVGYETDGEALIEAVANATWTKTPGFIFADALDVSTLPSDVGTAEATIEGSFGTVPSTPSGTAYEDFNTRFITAWGTAPQAYSASSYDAAYLLAIAMQGATDPNVGAQVKANLTANLATSGSTVVNGGNWNNIVKALVAGPVSYQGVSGPLVFDANNDVTTNIQEWEVLNQQVISVAPSSTGGCWTGQGVPCQ